MDDTTGLSVEQAADSLLAPVTKEPEEVETDEAPDLEEQTDPEETEADEDDTDEDDGEDTEIEEGDEEDEDDEDDAEDEELPDRYTVKVDGEEVEVTLDDLKSDYSGRAYIQKGMQEAAAQKKDAQYMAETLQREREQVLQLAQQLQRGGLQPPQEPNPDLIQGDPIAYMEQEAQYRRQLHQYQGQMQQLQASSQAQAEANRKAHMDYLQEQAKMVSQFIPEFSDAEKGQEVRGKLVKTGVDYGFSDDEVKGISDARMVRVLNDARKYRELQASKSTAGKKVQNARPKLKAGSKPKVDTARQARKQQRERLRKTGSVEDAVSLLLE